MKGTPIPLPGKIPWMEECGRLQSIGSQSRTQLSDFTSLHYEVSMEWALINGFWAYNLVQYF